MRITVLSFSEHEIIEYENSKASKNMDGCELFELQRHLLACKHSNGFPAQEGLFIYMTHSQMLGKFEYTGGPIFKVVLEC